MILSAKDTYDIAYLYASRRRVEKMKGMVASLNKKLKSLTRRGVRLEGIPIPKSEIVEEKKITPHPIEKKTEEETKGFTKQVSRVAKTLWMKAMKAGAKGVLIEDLMEELVLEGYPPSIFKTAIDYLEKNNQIHKLGWDRITSVASTSTSNRKEDEKLYEVEIEKVLPGKAICIINEERRARLVPEEYEGPPHLIKKNMRFKAYGTLYYEGKTLSIRVRKITEIL